MPKLRTSRPDKPRRTPKPSVPMVPAAQLEKVERAFAVRMEEIEEEVGWHYDAFRRTIRLQKITMENIRAALLVGDTKAALRLLSAELDD